MSQRPKNRDGIVSVTCFRNPWLILAALAAAAMVTVAVLTQCWPVLLCVVASISLGMRWSQLLL